MSLKEKIRLNFPLYFVLSLLFSVAVWSLWFPKWFGGAEDAQAAVTSFSTARTAVSKVPLTSQPKVIYNNGIYAMVFTSTTSGGSPTSSCVNTGSAGACSLYFTKSSDGGVTWTSPVLVSNDIISSGTAENVGSFSYDTRRGVYVAVFKRFTTNFNVVQAYSTDGSSWTIANVITDQTSGSNVTGDQAVTYFATSSDFRAVFAQRGPFLVVGTTTNTGLTTMWPTSTVQNVQNYRDAQSGDYRAKPLAISLSPSNVLQVVYALATTTAAGGYEIVFASSTDMGVTWASSSISGRMPVSSSQLACMECYANSASIDPFTNRISVLYYQFTAFDMAGIGSGLFVATTTITYGELQSSGSWSTSTVAVGVGVRYTFTNTAALSLRASGIITPYTGMPLAAFFGSSSNPYIYVNTSTPVVEALNSDILHNRSEISVAYNTSSQHMAVAYVDSSTYSIKFTTTSLKIAAYNSVGTITATPGITQSQNASGLVTVTTTVADSNFDTTTLYVDYSLDSGSTWTSTTIASATGESGSLSTSAGKITGIATTDGDQQISFTWDTSVILAASSTSNVKLRFLADDGISVGSYQLTSAFTVDNRAPGLPSELTFSSVETTSLSLLWTASTGTPTLYFTSSTALTASPTSTSATTTAYVNLTPNTQYLFQVKAQDTYSNTSSYSAVTSTYTDANAPSAISATNNGTSSLIVNWTSNNGSGTNYQLYNVTTGAVVATTTDTTYTVTGLSASTEYQFKVRAQFLQDNDSYSSYSSDSTAVSTSAASSGGGGGGGGGGNSNSGAAPAANPPAVPAAPAPVSASEQAQLSLAANVPQTRTLGASTHTFTYLSATEKIMNLRIQSDPINVTLSVNVAKDVDTNNDQIADVRATYDGLVQGKAKVTVKNLTDENELKNAFTIQAGAYETNSRTVRVMFNGNNIAQVALSNDPTFAGAAFVSYSSPMVWMLSSGNGQKTVYARLRSTQGGMVSVSDTITLATNSAPVIDEPVVPSTPVTPTKPSIPALARTLKRNMTGADVKQFQVELQKQGYFPKNIAANSVFGPTTEGAVKAFEKAKGLKVDGIVDAATWQVIFGGAVTESKPTAPVTQPVKKNLYRGSSGAEVTWVQQKLQSLGFFPKNVTANGYYGPTTEASVKSFQKIKGISQTGSVGSMTWEALNK